MMNMEITLLTKDSLRVKGKQGTLVINPPATGKIEADALLTTFQSGKTSATEGSRLTVFGPGEYEVAGIKITTTGHEGNLVHTIKVDNVTVITGNAQAIAKVHDKLSEPHIIACYVTEGSLQEVVTALAPRVVVLYGDKAADEAKNLGKEVKAVGKYQTTVDKLPADMEVVVLG
jgi:hypothetical protein